MDAGRRPEDIKIYAGVAVVPGRTEAEAREKYADYLAHASAESGLAHFAASTGVDFAQYGLDDPISFGNTNAIQSAVEAFTRADPSRTWTTAEIADYCAIGGDGPVLVGSAQTVADQLQEWVQDTDVDGFNLSRTVVPECFDDIISLVIPILQERGVYKTSYRKGTLREKLFGNARLPERHIGATCRQQNCRPTRGTSATGRAGRQCQGAAQRQADQGRVVSVCHGYPLP